MEKEQQEFTEVWSKKRDELVNEVSEITKQKETLKTEHDSLAESIVSMNEELQSWKDKKSEIVGELENSKGALTVEVDALIKEKQKVSESIDKQNKEFDRVSELRTKAKDELKEITTVVDGIKDIVINIQSELPSFLNAVREEFVTVRQTVNDLMVMHNYFKDNLNAIELAQANKARELEDKETYLNQREVILNNESNKLSKK